MSDTPQRPAAGWYDDGTGRQRWWDGAGWTEHYAPAAAAVLEPVPGRVPGFICGLIAILFTALPIASIPLGIVGWINSAKALKLLPPGTARRGLAVAGMVLSITALAITALIMVLALPGIVRANFG